MRETQKQQTHRFKGHTGEEAVDHHMIVVRQLGGAELLQQQLLGAQTEDQDVKAHAEIIMNGETQDEHVQLHHPK